jgi:hypothetical protein
LWSLFSLIIRPKAVHYLFILKSSIYIVNIQYPTVQDWTWNLWDEEIGKIWRKRKPGLRVSTFLTSQQVNKVHEFHKKIGMHTSLVHTRKMFLYRDCFITHAVSVGGNSIAYYQLSLISSKFAVMSHRLYSVLRYAEYSSMSHWLSVNWVWNTNWPTPCVRSLLGMLIFS